MVVAYDRISSSVVFQIFIIFFNIHYDVATLALSLRPRQGLVRLWAKKEAQKSYLMFPGVQKSVREWTFTLPSELPFGNWSPNGLPNLQKAIAGFKTHWIEKFFISLEIYWNLDV
jgi:hypothetical protein